MVGAVVVRDGRIIGMGHHKKFGGLHAEREALADCRRRGEDPRGATIYVTLEPCCHHGKQPPCTDALVEAGIARVIAARPDPNPVSGGGAAVLRKAGIECEFSNVSRDAIELSDPFVKRITTGMPWVVAKWAQTIDGRLVTRADEPRWISGEIARRRVHRIRSRVDAIVTGMGTILADDPMLTARGVARRRRTARRVVLDAGLSIPAIAQVVRTAADTPTIVLCSAVAAASPGRVTLESMGVQVIPVAVANGRLELGGALRVLAERFDATNVLLECGPRLLHGFFSAGLVDEAVVHVGSSRLDPGSGRAACTLAMPALATGFRLCRCRGIGSDTELIFRRA